MFLCIRFCLFWIGVYSIRDCLLKVEQNLFVFVLSSAFFLFLSTFIQACSRVFSMESGLWCWIWCVYVSSVHYLDVLIDAFSSQYFLGFTGQSFSGMQAHTSKAFHIRGNYAYILYPRTFLFLEPHMPHNLSYRLRFHRFHPPKKDIMFISILARNAKGIFYS